MSPRRTRWHLGLSFAAIVTVSSLAWSQGGSATAMLRLACDGQALNAEVTINDEFKGDCPIDVPVVPGSLRIRVTKKVDSERELFFEQEVRMVAGTVKRIDVEFGTPRLNAAARRLATQRAAAADTQAAAQSAAFIAAPGRTFKDCADCPEMVVLPSGRFQMGSNASEQAQANADGLTKTQTDRENPQRSVYVNSFAIGRYEVTQGQWAAVMGSNPSGHKDCGDTCPVDNVSWDDAQEFIQKLNQKTGKAYRLPSESEWEYACKAGANQTYCGSDNIDSVAVYSGNSGKKTQRAGSKQPNAWGLYDMSGNVWERVQDCWNENYSGAPSDGSARTTGFCSQRGVRGGGSGFEPSYSRAAIRFRNPNAYRAGEAGFRLARVAP